MDTVSDVFNIHFDPDNFLSDLKFVELQTIESNVIDGIPCGVCARSAGDSNIHFKVLVGTTACVRVIPQNRTYVECEALSNVDFDRKSGKEARDAQGDARRGPRCNCRL